MWDLFDVRTCRGCGCTNDEGCWPPCFWVGEVWCSACEFRLGRRLTWVAAALAFAGAVGAVVASSLMTADHRQSAIAVGLLTLVAIVGAMLLGRVARHMLEGAL